MDLADKRRERLLMFYLEFTPETTFVTTDTVNDARDVTEMQLEIFLQTQSSNSLH